MDVRRAMVHAHADACEGSTMRREARRTQPATTGPVATLSDRALELVDGPRQDEYAPPDRNMKNIGRVWAAMLDLPEPIPPEQVALMMCGLKLVRASYKPGEDSLVDLVGYAEIAERLR